MTIKGLGMVISFEIGLAFIQEKRAAAAKAQQVPPSHAGSISTPASGPVSPGIDSNPSGGVDRASSDAVAVAAAAMARTKSQGNWRRPVKVLQQRLLSTLCTSDSV